MAFSGMFYSMIQKVRFIHEYLGGILKLRAMSRIEKPTTRNLKKKKAAYFSLRDRRQLKISSNKIKQPNKKANRYPREYRRQKFDLNFFLT